MTTTSSWLPLAEYSIKHHVSISTLRRRIKASDIQFRFDDGKYFIFDEVAQNSVQTNPMQQNSAQAAHRPSLTSEVQAHAENTITAAPASGVSPAPGESVITAANRLLADLKKAYTQVLQEKEEQILTLREEIVDLRTLVKILETENARLHDECQ